VRSSSELALCALRFMILSALVGSSVSSSQCTFSAAITIAACLRSGNLARVRVQRVARGLGRSDFARLRFQNRARLRASARTLAGEVMQLARYAPRRCVFGRSLYRSRARRRGNYERDRATSCCLRWRGHLENTGVDDRTGAGAAPGSGGRRRPRTHIAARPVEPPAAVWRAGCNATAGPWTQPRPNANPRLPACCPRSVGCPRSVARADRRASSPASCWPCSVGRVQSRPRSPSRPRRAGRRRSSAHD
jgi:hypothetical protein